jgi:hypothetical protein
VSTPSASPPTQHTRQSPAIRNGTPPSQAPERCLCPYSRCNQEFTGNSRRGNMSRHIKTKHGAPGSVAREYHCSVRVCGKKFKRNDAKLNHERKEHPGLGRLSAVPRKPSNQAASCNPGMSTAQHTIPNQGGGTDNRITHYFRDNAVSATLTSMSMTAPLQELSRQPSLTEKLDLFERVVPSRRDPDEAINDMKPEDINDIKPEDDIEEDATAMRRSLYCDDRTGMDKIRRQVLEGLSEAADLTYCPNCSDSKNDKNRCSNHQSFYSVRFNVTWDLRGFLQSQFGNRAPRIGSLVALTGSALYAQATTCSDYLQTTWPCSGAFFLSTLQTAVDSGGNLNDQKSGNSTGKASLPLLTPHFTTIAWILISTLQCSYVLPKDHPTNILRHLIRFHSY